MKLYQFHPSGNCYKVRLLLTQMGIPFEKVDVDLAPGSSTAALLERLPFRRVPAMEFDDGTWMGESNAMMIHFAEGSRLYPADRKTRAEVLQWLFWEQYDHEPYIAVVRAWKKFFGIPAGREGELPRLVTRGEQALARMNDALSARLFIAGDSYTIADIALFAYTHVAGDGGFDLARYPAVQRWIERVKQQPGFLALEA